jgi:spore germination cell wall hydrolase CwlJ-like protein
MDSITPKEFKEKRAEEIQNNNDLLHLLYTVVLESRGEGEEGMFAVARSIKNRRTLIKRQRGTPIYLYAKQQKR